MIVIVGLTVSANIISALRIFAFNAAGRTRKFSYAAFATLMCIACVVNAFQIIFQYHVPSWFEAFLSITLCVMLLRSKGNVACLVRLVKRGFDTEYYASGEFSLVTLRKEP